MESTLPISTRRLTLRRFCATDAAALHAYLSDPAVLRYEPYPPFTLEQAESEAVRRADNPAFYAVCLQSGALIGNVYLARGEFDTWTLGYVFNRQYWGHGYATEAATAIIAHGFDVLGARRIIAYCNPLNTSSWRLLERVHMRREATMLQEVYFHTDDAGQPIWQDTYVYAMLKQEYDHRNIAGNASHESHVTS